MELAGKFFTTPWLVAIGIVLLPAWWLALRWANWRRLAQREQLHVFLGASVFLMLLWTLRTEIQPGFSWHLSGMVSLTLMFGWSLALIGGSLTLVGITLAGLNDWGGYLPSVLIEVLMPATLTQVVLGLVRAYLPKHYFIYVFINAFLAAGLISLLMALATTGLLLAVGAYSLQRLQDTYLLFLPLMFFPEGVLNGWTMSVLVGFRPDWVGSFRDEEYLDGK